MDKCSTTRILLVDDHAVLRDGIQMMISSLKDMNVVGTASNGRIAIEMARTLRPDVIVMDIAMPVMGGIEATYTICRELPGTKVIMLTMHDAPEYVHRAIRVGASGIVLKKSAGIEIIKAIRSVMVGQRFFSREIQRQDYPTSQGETSESVEFQLELLSQRELEVLRYISEGKTSAEIAQTLSLSPKSVETYRSRLLKKLKVDNMPTLVKLAIKHGVISSD